MTYPTLLYASLRCDEVILLSDKSDSIPYVIKANVMMQKALMEMQMAQMQQSQQLLAAAQNTMREVEGIFNEAIAIEPNGSCLNYTLRCL